MVFYWCLIPGVGFLANTGVRVTRRVENVDPKVKSDAVLPWIRKRPLDWSGESLNSARESAADCGVLAGMFPSRDSRRQCESKRGGLSGESGSRSSGASIESWCIVPVPVPCLSIPAGEDPAASIILCK